MNPYEGQWVAEEVLAMACMFVGMLNTLPRWQGQRLKPTKGSTTNAKPRTPTYPMHNPNRPQGPDQASTTSSSDDSKQAGRKRKKKKHLGDLQGREHEDPVCVQVSYNHEIYVLAGRWDTVRLHTVKRELSAQMDLAASNMLLFVNGLLRADDMATAGSVGFSVDAIIEVEEKERCSDFDHHNNNNNTDQDSPILPTDVDPTHTIVEGIALSSHVASPSSLLLEEGPFTPTPNTSPPVVCQQTIPQRWRYDPYSTIGYVVLPS